MSTRSHWACLVEGLSTSVQDSYAELESALNAREVPELTFSRVEYSEAGVGSAQREYMRITRKDYVFDVCAAPFGRSFFFSWWMSIPQLPFAILYTVGYFAAIVIATAAIFWPFRGSCFGYLLLPFLPFGAGIGLLFLMRIGAIFDEGVALRIPVVSSIYRAFFAPETYYRSDTQKMFEKAVHNALLEVVDAKISEQGLRALAPEDRRPQKGGDRTDLSALLGLLG